MSRLATTDKQAIARAFGTTALPRHDRYVTNRGFLHQRYKPSKRKPPSTKSPDTLTPNVDEARSFPTVQMLREVHNTCRVRGRIELHERVNDEQERVPQVGEADRPQKRRKGGLMSTPRQ